MSAFVEPQLATRAAALKESIWLRIGSLQLAMNDRDRSLDAFERVLLVNPSNIHAMTQMGAVLAKKELYSQAVTYLQRAINGNSSCGEAWAVLAHCYLMTNDLPKAYQAYEKALNHLQDPCDPNLWYGIGVLYNRYGSHDNALEAFLAVLRLAPNFERATEVSFYIGIIYKEQHKLDEAMKYFNRVSMVQNPPPPPLTRADVGFEIGHVHELKQDIPKALDMYKIALRENPHHAKTLQKLGWLEHFHKENPREGIRRLQMSLEADQTDGQTWYLLGRVYMAVGDFVQAYNAYQQAVIRDGRNATFWCSIGVLYYQMNQYNDAMDAYSRAIKLNPQVSEVWFDLGTLYESCGQTIDAIDSYRRASELAPEKTQIRERLNVLQNSLNQGANSAANNSNNAAQGQQPQQQHPSASQPAAPLSVLRQPQPHLPPPQSHPQLQQPTAHPQQQQLSTQLAIPPSNQAHPQTQSLPTHRTLPPVPGHSQALHSLSNPQSQLQPLGVRPPATGASSHGSIMQQPIPVLSQVHTSSGGHHGLPRHIMQYPLQQPPGGTSSHIQGSTGLHTQGQTHPSQASHLRSTLPHMSAPNSANNSAAQPPNVSQSQGPLQGGTIQRTAMTDPRGIPVGHPAPLPRQANINNNSLLQPLPQLPALPTTGDGNRNSASTTHPGSVNPGEAVLRNETASNPPQLPALKLPGKDGQLERIPSLQRPTIHPIPSLAPLANKGGNTNTENVGPAEPVEKPITSINAPLKSSPLPPLQHSKSVPGGSTLPPVSGTLHGNGEANGSKTGTTDSGTNNNNNSNTGTTDKRDTEERSNGATVTGSSSGHEDAKLLQSMALSTQESATEPKRSLLNSAPLPVPSTGSGSGMGQTSLSSPPPIPALPIPRSVPISAPATNAENNNGNSTPELRLGTLGASSLTKLGRPGDINAAAKNGHKLPTTLPSPLAQPKPQINATTTQLPQASIAVPSQQTLALPSLPSLTDKRLKSSINNDGNETSNGNTGDNKLAPLKSPVRDEKLRALRDNNNKGGMNGSDGNKGAAGIIPRSVPITSIASINNDENIGETGNGSSGKRNEENGNNGGERKREVSPGAVDTDKRYKRPRVHESSSNEEVNTEKRGREIDEEEKNNNKMNTDEDENEINGNGITKKDNINKTRRGGLSGGNSIRAPIAIPNNAPLPSFRSSRMKMGNSKISNNNSSGNSSNGSKSLGLHLRSAPFKSQKSEENKRDNEISGGKKEDNKMDMEIRNKRRGEENNKIDEEEEKNDKGDDVNKKDTSSNTNSNNTDTADRGTGNNNESNNDRASGADKNSKAALTAS